MTRDMRFVFRPSHEDPGASFGHDCADGKRFRDPVEVVYGTEIVAATVDLAKMYAFETLYEALDDLNSCPCGKVVFAQDEHGSPQVERWQSSVTRRLVGTSARARRELEIYEEACHDPR